MLPINAYNLLKESNLFPIIWSFSKLTKCIKYSLDTVVAFSNKRPYTDVKRGEVLRINEEMLCLHALKILFLYYKIRG
jgi:hypothetical protein